MFKMNPPHPIENTKKCPIFWNKFRFLKSLFKEHIEMKYLGRAYLKIVHILNHIRSYKADLA